MLQFKVPQNIRMPDQIIGPLTLEQFLYLLFGSAGIYMSYLYFGYGNTFYIISIPITLVAIAFAFVPVNEQPFSKFIMHLFLYTISPKVLTWQQFPPPTFQIRTESKQDKLKEKEELKHPTEIKSQLQQLSLILDTQITPETTIREKMAEVKEQDIAKQELISRQDKKEEAKSGTALPSKLDQIPTPADGPATAETTKPSSSIGGILTGLFKSKPPAEQNTQALAEKEKAKQAAIQAIINETQKK
ncbi:PrgI family protein [Patescibacteria group bacterium]|nr:PrgI family protein [Patescibacteria group bacterium]